MTVVTLTDESCQNVTHVLTWTLMDMGRLLFALSRNKYHGRIRELHLTVISFITSCFIYQLMDWHRMGVVCEQLIY